MKRKLKNLLFKIEPLKYYWKGRKIYSNEHFLKAQEKNSVEIYKTPSRTGIINYLLSINQNDTLYLEIGVRNPAQNFDSIKATKKYSVDPGNEFKLNPVDYKMTSDQFFKKLANAEILSKNIKFDVIFIDGLHLAEQVNRDIENSLKYIKEDGFIVLHDCNPPTEWHAREAFNYWHTPAKQFWNGTTWKAFLKWRNSPLVNSCCIDTDWGVGILSKSWEIGQHIECDNLFFEFSILEKNREKSLNLIDFTTFKKLVQN
jgi:hypothetical protein